MPRVLLADGSSHAQRLGEQILREEGFEVICVRDGEAALREMEETKPDVVLADISLPGLSGYELCRRIKQDGAHRHVRVILTAGLMADFDSAQAAEIQSDGFLRKPFEASAVLELLRPGSGSALKTGRPAGSAPAALGPPAVTPERIRAAVTVALDAAMPEMVERITREILAALRLHKDA
jgi:CheY-like chemotaxis protein